MSEDKHAEYLDKVQKYDADADPEVVKAVQLKYGRQRSADAIEAFFADLARDAVAQGVERIITAGGETSGAVVDALGVDQMMIGPEIDPGVPPFSAEPKQVNAHK